MQLYSPQIKQNSFIPEKYTCEGDNIVPPLEWTEVPPKTQSFALTMHDPDVPDFVREDNNFDHWVVWNIHNERRHVDEGQEDIGIAGMNTGGTLGYTGPCPPDAEHRYIFRVYALDTTLDLPMEETGRAELESAIDGHILDSAELIGVYNKKENR